MIDRLLEARPAIARGVLDRHGRSEAYHVGIPRGVRDIYPATVAGVPIRIVTALVSHAASHILLYHTRIGTYSFALGGNRKVLKYACLAANGS